MPRLSAKYCDAGSKAKRRLKLSAIAPSSVVGRTAQSMSSRGNPPALSWIWSGLMRAISSGVLCIANSETASRQFMLLAHPVVLRDMPASFPSRKDRATSIIVPHLPTTWALPSGLRTWGPSR